VDISVLPPLFVKKVDFSGGCWEWTAAKDRRGYGRFRWQGRVVFSHRLAYELLVAPATGLDIDHLCRNPGCCNPEHLEAVSHAVNVGRGLAAVVNSEKWSAPRECPHGHPLSDDNLYVHYNARLKRLNRQCRTCKRESTRRRRAKARAVSS
jgi:hypothetical protein